MSRIIRFFFRRAGSDETFELTHKTFGEYLAARRLMRLVAELHRLLPTGDIDEGEGLRRWYRLTHAGRITLEILSFLQNELRGLPLEEVKARRETLIRLFDENLASGMPHLGVDGHGQPKTYREAERFTAAAELALFAAIGVCTWVMIGKTEGLPPEARRQAVGWSPTWPDRDRERRISAWDLLRRLEAASARELCARGCMHGISLDDQILRADLAEAGLVCASARSIDLFGANLSDADLRGADFQFANIRDGDLRRTNLHRANLSDADLRGADLRRADLRRANLSNANLRDANLRRANLADAKGVTRRQLNVARNVPWDRVPSDLDDA